MAVEQRGDDLSGSGGGNGKPNLWGNGSWLRDGDLDTHWIYAIFLYQHNEPPLYVQQFFFVRQKFRSASWLNLSKYFFEAHFLAIILNGLSVEVLGENHNCRNFNIFVK